MREIVETGEIDIDELDDVLAAQLDSIKGTGRLDASRSNRRTTCVSVLASPDRADTLRLVTSRRATGGPKVDVDSHQGESITDDLTQRLVETRSEGNTALVNRLDQLFAQSQREIEAHALEIAATEIGRYYIDEAAHLLTGLRMWAQAQYRSDQVVREILEAGDGTALQQVARELRTMKNREATVASWPVEAIAKWPAEQLTAVSSYALRAL